MDTRISKESIAEKLITIICSALRIDEKKVTPEARIINDLNAESLDILDIRFNIEQELGLKIGEHEIVNTIGNGLTQAQFMEKFTVSNLTDFLFDKSKTSKTE